MKYKLGDPVRIIASPSRHFDVVGTVADVDPGAYYPYRVDLDNGPLWFGAHELVLAEAPNTTNDERPAA